MEENSLKLFISYSWSSPDHEQWVLDLATRLCEDGVDVKLDKWDLKEGQDKYNYMESMVNDPAIKKVAIICDKKYVEKANSRTGGVGTETLIISKEVYEKVDQQKFVAVVVEEDENGHPYSPTYIASRIYINMVGEKRYFDGYDQLLRWVYDKPLYVKPNIGKMPSFLSEGEHISLGTTIFFRKCSESIKNDKPNAAGSFDEYCTAFSSNLENFRLTEVSGDLDEAVIKNIEEFKPYRDEFIQLLTVLAQYNPKFDYTQRIHRLFETLIPYLDITHQPSYCDNFRFLIHELFLYSIAILLKYELFGNVSILLNQKYYWPDYRNYGMDEMTNCDTFFQYIQSLDTRNKRLNLRSLSLQADLLNNRCSGLSVEFYQIAQADFVIFLNREISESKHSRNHWWPVTLVYFSRSRSPFEIFSRSISKIYFDKIKVILEINNIDDLTALINRYRNSPQSIPRFGGLYDLDPASLINYDKLATEP